MEHNGVKLIITCKFKNKKETTLNLVSMVLDKSKDYIQLNNVFKILSFLSNKESFTITKVDSNLEFFKDVFEGRKVIESLSFFNAVHAEGNPLSFSDIKSALYNINIGSSHELDPDELPIFNEILKRDSDYYRNLKTNKLGTALDGNVRRPWSYDIITRPIEENNEQAIVELFNTLMVSKASPREITAMLVGKTKTTAKDLLELIDFDAVLGSTPAGVVHEILFFIVCHEFKRDKANYKGIVDTWKYREHIQAILPLLMLVTTDVLKAKNIPISTIYRAYGSTPGGEIIKLTDSIQGDHMADMPSSTYVGAQRILDNIDKEENSIFKELANIWSERTLELLSSPNTLKSALTNVLRETSEYIEIVVLRYIVYGLINISYDSKVNHFSGTNDLKYLTVSLEEILESILKEKNNKSFVVRELDLYKVNGSFDRKIKTVSFKRDLTPILKEV